MLSNKNKGLLRKLTGGHGIILKIIKNIILRGFNIRLNIFRKERIVICWNIMSIRRRISRNNVYFLRL